MAIIDARPGVEVTVTSGNRTLREHREKETIDAPNTVTNYIEVNSFESFEVSIETFNDFAQGYDFQVKTWLDGVFIESHVRILNASRKNRLDRAPGVKTEVNRCLCACDLQFTPFLIGDSKNIGKVTKDRLKEVGTITIRIHRVENVIFPSTELKPNDFIKAVPAGIQDFEKVPEEAIHSSGLSHYASGYQKPVARSIFKFDRIDGEAKDQDANAYATFHFKYRSLEKLNDLGIILDTPEEKVPLPASLLETLASATLEASAAAQEQILNNDSERQDEAQGQCGLSKAEIIALIMIYRGRTYGLEFLSEKELLGLLNYHRKVAMPQPKIKRERDDDDDSGNTNCVVKRQKSDATVLDD